MCPMCIRSKTPWHWTTLTPFFSRRRSASVPASASISLTLPVDATRRALRGQKLKPFLRRFRDRRGIPDRRLAPVIDVGQHDSHAVLEFRLRLPAEHLTNLRRVGERAVRLARPLRNVDGVAADQPGEQVHAVRVRTAD